MTLKKPITTMNGSELEGAASPVDLTAEWSEARLAYPLYAALANQFSLVPASYPPGELPPLKPRREIFDRDMAWLDSVDEKARAYQIRQLPPETLNTNEETLRAFIRRQLKKRDKTLVDRDKIDLLLVQYFALCAPDELYRNEVKLGDVASVLHPVLSEADPTPLEWFQPLEQILKKVEQCHSLRDMMELGLLEQGRLLKDAAGCMFYDPAALVAFCRFNFLLRRAFIRLLHADLSAVRQAVEALDTGGVKTVDCRRAGFSAAETTAHLRSFCENWRQPFQKDYTESSVSRAFEQLLALRADLEEALSRVRSEAATPRAHTGEIEAALDAAVESLKPMFQSASSVVMPAERPETAEPPLPEEPGAPVSPPAKRPDAAAAPTARAEAEKCLESIWEQLIAAPPSRGRSMSTVVLQDTKVLLSSWEVAAFVAEGDQEAEDLRRAVVARALLALAMERRKRSGEEGSLVSALLLARREVSYFQGRVEQAKRAKNTEAAVNLGISTKRLLSFIEEAEKLQP